MHASWFSYNLTKPYPFRWFTPLTIIGGIILTVLFSLINLAANGYYMRTVYTNDPNTTVRDGEKWFMRSPFNWGDRLRPQCEPRLLTVGDQLFTTNLGFTWEITSISQPSTSLKGFTSLPSIPYLNNTLEDCRLDKVSITLIKADLNPPPGWWISWTPSYVTTSALCTISTESGPASIALQTPYQTLGDSSYNYVIEDNYTTHASVWWGTRLLNAYWIGLESIMSTAQLKDDSEFFMRGVIDYHWNYSETKSVRDLDFFSLTFYLLTSDSSIVNDENVNNVNGGIDSSAKLIELYNDKDTWVSWIALEGLHFAKLMHSVLSIDLGNPKWPNLLTNENDLQYILAAPDDPNRQPGGGLYDNPNMNGWELLAKIPLPTETVREKLILFNESYAQFALQMGPLQDNGTATFISQYACSIPTQRSTVTMLVAILIADLVFLQAAWKLLVWSTDGIVKRRDPAAMFCQGCMKDGYNVVGLHPLASTTPRTGSRHSVASINADSTHGLLFGSR